VHQPGSELADVGALHVAEFFDNVRFLRRFAPEYAKAALKKKR
jgi:hypothetical protein